ncbi:nitrosopumilus output domain 1 [Nitrososphaeria virus YSH_922147]|uniref:Nitrosopumilus output domain 1 n=1 Tax=Nitrososphaeria virus YSH_922147 TaxID=3071323 RepID=A0A976UAU0_9CAUD|nr:nitrosopumilus output domain 1 [Yangshan Harbor Nitrososphaeria virus]UVF62476.1 nitrosopumilus output domain 1 [Nitrososphaeria virus YSH_922147]
MQSKLEELQRKLDEAFKNDKSHVKRLSENE